MITGCYILGDDVIIEGCLRYKQVLKFEGRLTCNRGRLLPKPALSPRLAPPFSSKQIRPPEIMCRGTPNGLRGTQAWMLGSGGSFLKQRGRNYLNGHLCKHWFPILGKGAIEQI